MLYTCDSNLNPIALSGRPDRASGKYTQFAVDVHCHVFVPEAAKLVGDAFDPDMDDLFKYANEATRVEAFKSLPTAAIFPSRISTDPF